MSILSSMDTTDFQILKEFQAESKTLIEKMHSILENCEGHFDQAKSLEECGQAADRIMGAAKTLAEGVKKDHLLHKIADYAAICKSVSYKASQIKDNEQFYEICVGLLLDGIEVLKVLVIALHGPPAELKKIFSKTFLERLRWVNSQFSNEYQATASVHKDSRTKLSQSEVDELIKKLGFD